MSPPVGVAVAAGHEATVAAGRTVLEAGGGAVDAGVAMMLVSCAAETIFTGLGGGGFATVYEAATGTATCVDFFVAVPGLGERRAGPGVAIESRLRRPAGPLRDRAGDRRGPGGAGGRAAPLGALGPAAVDRRRGARARGLARHAVPRTHAELLPRIVPAMCVGEGELVYRRPDGALLAPGDPLRHPDHHRAYALLADDPRAFYRGAYADALLDALADGSALAQADLDAYAVVESTPARARFDDLDVLARGDDLDDVLGTLQAAGRAVPGDPHHDLASALGLVDALRAPDRRAETTNLVAVDERGDACVITTSLGLGSGVWVPGYGVHLNSMLGEGELVRAVLDPGVRMGSMMSPLVALDAERRLVAAAGAAGGSRIRPALVQTLLRVLRGTPPQQAVDAARLNALPDLVRLEPGFDPAVVRGLEEAGIPVAVAEGIDPYFGGVSAVSALGAGSDPRRSGHAWRA